MRIINKVIVVFFFSLCVSALIGQRSSTTLIDSLKRIAQTETNDSIYVTRLSSISYNYREVNIDSAISYAERTLDQAQKISSQYRIARCQRFLADTYEHAGLLDQARVNYNSAIRIFERLEKPDEVSTTLLSLSIVLTKDYKVEEAISILHELINLSDSIGDWDLGTYSRINLSGLYIKQYNFGEAINQAKDAEKIFEGLDLSDQALREYVEQQRPLIYNNIGSCYNDLGRPDSAMFYFRRAYDQTIQK